MNEELYESNEKPSSPERYADNTKERSAEIEKQHHERATQAAAEKDKESVSEMRRTAEHEARSSSELQQAQAQQEDAPEESSYVSGELKSLAGKELIAKARRHLRPTERQFSKFIHNTAVDKLSDVTGNTVARPSGLLVGGLFSLISSFSVLMICRHYGYEYNFFITLVVFVGGFALGLLLEAMLRLFKKTTS